MRFFEDPLGNAGLVGSTVGVLPVLCAGRPSWRKFLSPVGSVALFLIGWKVAAPFCCCPFSADKDEPSSLGLRLSTASVCGVRLLAAALSCMGDTTVPGAFPFQ